MLELSVREGSVADEATVLALFDESVRWLVARGQPGQWGSGAASHGLSSRRRPRWSIAPSATARSASPSTTPRSSARWPSAPRHRTCPGTPLGLATEMALERRARMMRVDCWADSPALIAFYEQHGFTRQGQFDLRGWRGQVLGKLL